MENNFFVCFGPRFFTSFVITLVLAFNAFGWGNGGKSAQLNNPKFGSHDWIAYQGYKLADQDADLKWLQNNLNAYYIGTEAPDVGALSILMAGPGYKDTGSCHCILYDVSGNVTNNRVAMRAQQEFNKARKALDKAKSLRSSGKIQLAKEQEQLAAFYVGAMAHYLGDLSQFMHLMGKKSHWGSEDQKIHSRYEKVIDNSISFTTKKSSILEIYVKKINIGGNTAEEIARSVAKFDETGNGTIRNPGWMYDEYKSYIQLGTADKADEWDEKFLDQTGQNVNASINGIAKLLVKISSN